MTVREDFRTRAVGIREWIGIGSAGRNTVTSVGADNANVGVKIQIGGDAQDFSLQRVQSLRNQMSGIIRGLLAGTAVADREIHVSIIVIARLRQRVEN